MKIKIKWDDYKSRRGVSVLAWLREKRVSDYPGLVARCDSLGVEAPREDSEEVVSALAAWNSEKLELAVKSSKVVDDLPAPVKKRTPKKPSSRSRSKKSTGKK